ncbi:suppressor of cytokine signaling 7 [Cichlidogyrus casuarinus]|uniref:Suppressor of cytokine signaling 7 n=1 Tax=Cichlidogyrus casuarinus TaxID=1844966 RepID=A0ABD2QJ86_9PLAT
MGWYWGPLSFKDAEKLLEGKVEGTFLVRNSGSGPSKLSLSFKARNSIYHTRIEQIDGNSPHPSFATLQ